MTRKRLLRGLFSALFITFLIFILFRFKPGVGVKVKPLVTVPPEKGAPAGQLSAKGFHYHEETKGKLDYEITAERISEETGGKKNLSSPVVKVPEQGTAWGELGAFNPVTHELRIWKNAHVKSTKGWVMDSTGFRFTKAGTLVSEAPVTFHRSLTKGNADLFRYNRNSRRADLEGKVRIDGPKGGLSCSSLRADLNRHDGEIAGPVRLFREKMQVTAPSGTMKLDKDNRLRRVKLGTPSLGTAPSMKYRADSTTAEFSKDGSLVMVRLAGRVVAETTGSEWKRLETSTLDLEPAGDRWKWFAPSSMSMTEKTAEAKAVSGSGKIGGKTPMEANLSGPVKGSDSRGSFTGDTALLRGDRWTLLGNAVATTADSRLTAEQITRRKNGSYFASGNVNGRKKMKDGQVLTFKSDKASAGPGGYPVHLKGAVEVVRGKTTMSAPVVMLDNENTMRASGGGKVVFNDKKEGASTVTGETITYDGASHRAMVTGNALGRGRGYELSAESLTAFLDNENRPESYEAEGCCHFDGEKYRGSGERLEYNPTEESGKAESKDSSAEVYDKEAKRRLAGRVIIFGKDRLTVPRSEGGLTRGELEGSDEKGKVPAKGGKSG